MFGPPADRCEGAILAIEAEERNLGAEESGVAIGFTILSKDSATSRQAEFRIALNPDYLGQGFGKMLTRMALEKGFQELELQRIYLIVRKKNPRARRLYENCGFVETGECRKEIQRIMVDLFEICVSGGMGLDAAWNSAGEEIRAVCPLLANEMALTGHGVTVFDAAGRQIEHIDVPEGWTANVAFSGPDHQTLFITASEAIYSIHLRVKGANAAK